MKLVTRDTDYAVRALVYMAQQRGRLVTSREMVDELRIPRAFLRRILQQLGRHAVLKPIKGKMGGFVLSLPAEKIRLTDVMRIFQGSLEISECMFKKQVCPNRAKCFLRKRIVSIEAYVVNQLRAISIASLLTEAR
jgi:Rrf2 family protein